MEKLWDSKIRILAADDEQSNLDIFKQIIAPDSPDNQNELSDLDELESKLFSKDKSKRSVVAYELVTCENSKEVVEVVKKSLAEERPIAIAYLDVRMPPGLNGLWAAKQIRALDSDIEIVIVTGYSDVEPDDFDDSLLPSHKILFVKWKNESRILIKWKLLVL